MGNSLVKLFDHFLGRVGTVDEEEEEEEEEEETSVASQPVYSWSVEIHHLR